MGTDDKMVTNINEFRKALEFVLKWEGGYSNDPQDPGKETKWGISKKSYPDLDIKNLTEEKALEIYEKDYWNKMGCDNLPWPMSAVVFDTGVNCGTSRALKWLREADDADQYIELRKLYYYKLVEDTSWAHKYIRGWYKRLQDLQKFVDQYKA